MQSWEVTYLNTYINGLVSTKHRDEILWVADDTVIFYQANIWKELKKIVEKVLLW